MIVENLFFEAAVIFLLILANGFFAASEIAMIAIRKSRIDTMIEKGVKCALIIGRLKKDPDRFLATVQIGVTIVSSLASALGGAAAISFVKPAIEATAIPAVAPWADVIAIAVVVIPISYLSLVFGELVPKSLALRFSEQIACMAARPIDLLSRLSSFLVRILTGSSNAVLRLFGGSEVEGASFISVEEVKSLIREGAAKGIFNETEKELIHGVFELADTPVKAVMVPRTEIHALEIHSTPSEAAASFIESGFSRIPIYDGELDHVVGVLYNKDFFKTLQQKTEFRIKDHLHPAFFVPSTLPISELLKQLQRRRLAMAMVVNEFGEVEGLATLEDLLEEIVGEIRDEYDVESETVTDEGNGVFVFSGKVNVDEVRDRLGVEIQREGFETLGGYLLSHLGHMPYVGETFEVDELAVEVLEVERRRITKVRVARHTPAPATD